MVTLPILPNLYGFSITKKPVFQTIVQSFKSGREVTNPEQIYPLWEFELKYETLKDQTQNQAPYTPNLGFDQFETLSSIFTFCNGQYGRFLFEDLSDNSRTNQPIAIGDGHTVAFNMVSTITDINTGNQFTQNVGRVNEDHIVNVYVNAILVPSSGNWGLDTTGTQIVFLSAPPPSAVITADFYYYYSCRFISDEQDFEQFVMNWWTASLKFRSAGSGVANPVPLLSGWSGVAMSSDGTDIIIGAFYEGPKFSFSLNNGSIWISHDKGLTFTKNLAAGLAQWNSISCSSNAQYILAQKNSRVIMLSQDGGVSWSEIGPGNRGWGGFAVSDTGQNMIACSCEDPASFLPTNFWYSHDFGSTWTAAPDIIGAYTPLYLGISSTGQVGSYAQNNFPATNKILQSGDFGEHWAGNSAFPTGPSTFGNLVTGNGLQIMAASAITPSDPFTTSAYYGSFDTGATWFTGVPVNQPGAGIGGQVLNWVASQDGSVGYVAFTININQSLFIFTTNDWFQTFSSVPFGPTIPYQREPNGIFCSKDGTVIISPDTFSGESFGRGAIWISRDSGATWSATVPVDEA